MNALGENVENGVQDTTGVSRAEACDDHGTKTSLRTEGGDERC